LKTSLEKEKTGKDCMKKYAIEVTLAAQKRAPIGWK
jgi:hypothetical protein